MLISHLTISQYFLGLGYNYFGMEVLDMRDLWPEDIGPISDLKAPVSILREQGALLGKKTNNLVEAEVVQLEAVISEEREFSYAFLIVAPALDNYRYKLFTISCGINLYPITINVDRDIQAEIPTNVRESEENQIRQFRESLLFGKKPEVKRKLVAESEDEFMEILKKIFSAKKTKKVIGALLSMISYGQEVQIAGINSNDH